MNTLITLLMCYNRLWIIYSHTSKRYEYLNLYSDDAAAAAAAADDE